MIDAVLSWLTSYWTFAGVLAGFAVLEWLFPWQRKALEPLRWLHAFVLSVLGMLASIVILPVSSAGAALIAKENGWGLFNGVEVPSLLAIVTGVLLLDFTQWTCHWAMHRYPFFWRIHRVHHSDETVDVTTSFRFHPVEALIRATVQMAVVVLAGLPVMAIVIKTVLNMFFDIWEHANIQTPRPLKALSVVFVTPDQHRIHHDENIARQTSNLGTIFSIWDRLFGSLKNDDPAVTGIVFGLGKDNTLPFRTLANLLIDPFRKG